MDLTRKQALTGLAGILATGVAPAAFVKSMIVARGVAFGGGEKLPYDEELEYIESNGNQYINTLLWDSDLDYASVDFLQVQTVYYGGMLSNYKGNSYNNVLIGPKNNDYGYQVFMSSGSPIITDNSIQNTSRHIVAAYRIGMKVFINVDNGAYLTSSILDTRSANPNYIGLFGQDYTGKKYWMKARLWGCECKKNNVTVANFIPVLNNGNACLYDVIRKQLFENLGTGSFGYKKKDGTIVAPV